MKRALLLSGSSELLQCDRLTKICAAFGVGCDQIAVPVFLRASRKGKARLFASPGTFLELVAALETTDAGAADWWGTHVHSVFVSGGNDQRSTLALAKRITGAAAGSLVKVRSGSDWMVTDNLPEFCRSMGGVRVPAAMNGAGTALNLDGRISNVTKIIFGADGAAFCRLEYKSVPIFLSTADIIDVDVPLQGRNFDIRPHFLSAVPVVLYVKWAFAQECWQPAETRACLVIDDPLLRPRYGHLNFDHLLGLMDRLDFAANVAFIPWNWNRSARRTARLFQENANRFSLSIHGCDHTGGEYGIRDHGQLAWKSRQSIQRMVRHQSRTGLSFDPVMVFPQGVFSEAAMDVLKRDKFLGVVNSEVISADPQPPIIKISDCWDVAVMNHSDFPIFTRRYPSEGIENFAFDVLLGKPCIVVVHHNDCHDNCHHVAEIIERLNNLNVRLRWCNLAEVVRRSFRQRESSPNAVEVEMYGSEVRVENLSDNKKVFRFRKRESSPSIIREIRAAAQAINWTAAESHISFEIYLNSGESKTVTVTFKAWDENEFIEENILYRVKVLLRRRCCEVRDNYVMSKILSAMKIKNLPD